MTDVMETMAKQFAMDKAKKVNSEPDPFYKFIDDEFSEILEACRKRGKYSKKVLVEVQACHSQIRESVLEFVLENLVHPKIKGKITAKKMDRSKLCQMELGTLWWVEQDGKQLFPPIDFSLELN